jgi:N4-gp56 family major capsid protein
MATTESSALSAAITFKTQKKVLENLRNELFWADPSFAEQGEALGDGFDTLLFTNVPDLSPNMTPLTEGVAPTPQALTMGTVSISTEQYGDSVSVTDVAKRKSPIPLINIGSERLTRASKEVIDQVTRDVIAGGGTVMYAGTGNAARADVAAGDLVTVALLKRLDKRMFLAGIPRHADGFYHLACSAEVAYDLSEDSDFVEAYKYVDNTPLLRNEIGKIAGFRIQEVANAPTFASTTTVHASIATGAVKGWGAGELSSLTTYHVAPGGDHGDLLAQIELMGWKVDFGVGVLSNDYFFRVESGATDLSA